MHKTIFSILIVALFCSPGLFASPTPWAGSDKVDAISPDGRFILFSTNASELVAPSHVTQTFVYDSLNKSLRLISSMDGTIQNAGSRGSYGQAISNDGKTVLFVSSSPEFFKDTYHTTDKNLHQLLLSKQGDAGFRRISQSKKYGYPRMVYNAVISDDANIIAYTALLTPQWGQVPLNSQIVVFDQKQDQEQVVTTHFQSTEFYAGSDPQVSSDGRYIVFWMSGHGFIPGVPNSTNAQVYWLDLKTGERKLVSSVDGTADQISNRDAWFPYFLGDPFRVGFVTDASNLHSACSKNRWKHLAKDLALGGISEVLGNDTDSFETLYGNSSKNGRFFASLTVESAPNLTSTDQYSIYLKDLVSGTTIRAGDAGCMDRDCQPIAPHITNDGEMFFFNSPGVGLIPDTSIDKTREHAFVYWKKSNSMTLLSDMIGKAPQFVR